MSDRVFPDSIQFQAVLSNLEKNNIPYHEWNEELMDEFAKRLAEMNKARGWDFRLATCGEKINISKYFLITYLTLSQNNFF